MSNRYGLRYLHFLLTTNNTLPIDRLYSLIIIDFFSLYVHIVDITKIQKRENCVIHKALGRENLSPSNTKEYMCREAVL